MLYTDEASVPWPGLSSVTESPDGGTANPFYLDGRKILNTTTGQDFGATIAAFGAPPEFASCAGQARISTGLYAADQPKESFGFSYRTMIGSDTAGIQFAYKVHVVYNATAKIADYTHTTDSASPSVSAYSWDISTFPVSIKGYKPTSHFIFDTRFVQPYIIGRLEAILYGDENDDPRMPTPEEIVTLLTNPPGTTWWDLTGLDDFPSQALVGDMGVDFSTDDLYADVDENTNAYWWDLTGGQDFPSDAVMGDWGFDTITGEVWLYVSGGSVDIPKFSLDGSGNVV
jgi:hypothetical protein